MLQLASRYPGGIRAVLLLCSAVGTVQGVVPSHTGHHKNISPQPLCVQASDGICKTVCLLN